MKFAFYFLFVVFGCFSFSSIADTKTIGMDGQLLFDDVVRQIERLDGDGLLPRNNRPETFAQTLKKLSVEASEAATLFELGRVFRRLDATYPNLHAHLILNPKLNEAATSGRVSLPFRFFPERSPSAGPLIYRLSISKPQLTNLKTGDILLAINGKTMDYWEKENFLFCKFPLREQCLRELQSNFTAEILGWNRAQKLTVQILRGEEKLEEAVNVEVTTTAPSKTGQSQCSAQSGRYKDFSLVHKGIHVCAFESVKHPQTVVLRISSFYYEKSSLQKDVDKFAKLYWQAKAPTVEHLIIDVIDNHGGDIPVPYYALLVDEPFQEMFVKYKKIAEFERPDILQTLFWGEPGKTNWFAQLKSVGEFAKINEGEFLPPVPQFCASSKGDCLKTLFPSQKSGFRGKIKILVNQYCISSCVGFVYNVKRLLSERTELIGFPDSGDSAYSRLAIMAKPVGAKTQIQVTGFESAGGPQYKNEWVQQVVSVTRSSDESGHVISGVPQTLHTWVPQLWDESSEDWAKKVFQEALL